jgi:nitroreductase/Pyruvate/2-oxoacid:ferredoxin oxidoreductase delta subunit
MDKNLKKIMKGNPVSISIDKDKCVNCEQCLNACPLIRCGGFEDLEGEYVRRLCIECRACAASCPEKAITVGESQSLKPVSSIPSDEEMLELIKSRRSIRAFQDEPVKQELLERLAEAVNYSPTGHHSQYIHIMFIRSPAVLKKISGAGMELFKAMAARFNRFPFSAIYKKALGEHTYSVFSKMALFYDKQAKLVEKGMDPVLFNAPCIALFLGPKSEYMAKNDADLAAQTVSLLAPTLGLGTCNSGIVSSAFSGLYPPIKKIVKIPDGLKVYNALIIGYPRYRYSFIPPRKSRTVYYV